MCPNIFGHGQETLPGEEVLQRSGLVLLLAHNPVSLLLLHLADAGGEGVDVVEHSLHGDGNFIGLLTKKHIDKNQLCSLPPKTPQNEFSNTT